MRNSSPFPDEDWPGEPWDRPFVKRRKRKPTLRGVLAQAQRAGVEIASVRVNPDGSIAITPGKPEKDFGREPFGTDPVDASSEWDVL